MRAWKRRSRPRQAPRATGKFRIKRGDVSVQAEPGTGAGKLRVECPGRFTVLPDFFADDITIDATRLPLDAVELPSENFVLHLTGDGDAIAMCVFENRKAGRQGHALRQGDRRIITGSEVGFEGKKIWVALLEAPKIWHTRELKAADTGKVIPLDWTMPFPAQWRVDFTRSNDLTDSWEMLLQEKKNGKYTKPSWLGGDEEQIDRDRHRWNTVLGPFPTPAGPTPTGKATCSRSRARPSTPWAGDRLPDQPGEANAAGCLHGGRRDAQYPGCRPLPAHPRPGRAEIRVQGQGDLLGARHAHPIYEKNEQKEKRAEVDETLDEGLTFVKHIRGRIARYVEFGKEMRQYLAEQKKSHRELSEFIAEMDRLKREIDDQVAARADKIKTPGRRRADERGFPQGGAGRRRARRAEALQGVRPGPGGDRRQSGRTIGRMPLGGEGPAAAGGHPDRPRPPGGADRRGDPRPDAGSAA